MSFLSLLSKCLNIWKVSSSYPELKLQQRSTTSWTSSKSKLKKWQKTQNTKQGSSFDGNDNNNDANDDASMNPNCLENSTAWHLKTHNHAPWTKQRKQNAPWNKRLWTGTKLKKHGNIETKCHMPHVCTTTLFVLQCTCVQADRRDRPPSQRNIGSRKNKPTGALNKKAHQASCLAINKTC